MRLLDLYSRQGGAAMGYSRAGFEVVGVDIEPQRRFPFEFVQGDAIEYLKEHGHEFDVIHASPPCQLYSKTHRIMQGDHVDDIARAREALIASGKPYVIENVEDARGELIEPVMLCGASFGLHTYRHRLFESNVPLVVPQHQKHIASQVKMGRALQQGDWYHAVGNFISVDYVRRDMDVEWMTREGIRECIPPAYAEYIGRQLKEM